MDEANEVDEQANLESNTPVSSKKRARDHDDIDGDLGDDEEGERDDDEDDDHDNYERDDHNNYDRDDHNNEDLESDHGEVDTDGAHAVEEQMVVDRRVKGRSVRAYVGDIPPNAVRSTRSTRKVRTTSSIQPNVHSTHMQVSGNTTANTSSAVTPKKATKKTPGRPAKTEVANQRVARKSRKETKEVEKKGRKGSSRGRKRSTRYDDVSAEDEVEEEGGGEGDEDEMDVDEEPTMSPEHPCERCRIDNDICLIRKPPKRGHPWRQCTACRPKKERCSFLTVIRPRVTKRRRQQPAIATLEASSDENEEVDSKENEEVDSKKNTDRPFADLYNGLVALAGYIVDVNEAGPAEARVPPPKQLLDFIGRVSTSHSTSSRVVSKPPSQPTPGPSTTPGPAVITSTTRLPASSPPVIQTLGTNGTSRTVKPVPTNRNTPDVFNTEHAIPTTSKAVSGPDAAPEAELDRRVSPKPSKDSSDEDMEESDDEDAVTKDNAM